MTPNALEIVAVIPARGGSKRLPGKNIRLLAGLPLIAWTIRSAIRNRAQVPWLRPPKLATNTASSIDVVLQASSAYESGEASIDSLLLSQPTCPFRSVETHALIVKQPKENADINGVWDWRLAECIAAGLALDGGAAWHRD